ncbi:hypothetical protein AAMO2058_001190100 [Amorphochlora amoebiformis]
MVARRVVWWISTAILLGVCLPISVCIWLPAMGVVLLRLLFLQCLGALTQLPDCAKGRPRIFFDGTGHLYPFSLGVTAHMMETYTLHSSTLFFAISGGNLSVLCILLNLSPNDLLESQRRLLDDASWLPAMGLLGNLEGLRVWLEETLPLDFHIKATGRLVVVVSYWPTLGFHYISEFSSRSVLIDAIIASCRFPILSWRPQLLPIGGSFFKQCLMFDAGFQNGITPLDELMDLSIRTFPRFPGDPSLTPTGFQTTLIGAALPLTHHRAKELMGMGRRNASRYLASRLGPHSDTKSNGKYDESASRLKLGLRRRSSDTSNS